MCGPLAFGRPVERFVTRLYRTGKKGRCRLTQRHAGSAGRYCRCRTALCEVVKRSDASLHHLAGDAGRKVLLCICNEGRLVCARVKKKFVSHAARPRGRRKRGTPPFMGGVHMKKRKEYLTEGQRRRSSSVRSALGQACLSFGGCDSMRHGVVKRSRDM